MLISIACQVRKNANKGLWKPILFKNHPDNFLLLWVVLDFKIFSILFYVHKIILQLTRKYYKNTPENLNLRKYSVANLVFTRSPKSHFRNLKSTKYLRYSRNFVYRKRALYLTFPYWKLYIHFYKQIWNICDLGCWGLRVGKIVKLWPQTQKTQNPEPRGLGLTLKSYWPHPTTPPHPTHNFEEWRRGPTKKLKE